LLPKIPRGERVRESLFALFHDSEWITSGDSIPGNLKAMAVEDATLMVCKKERRKEGNSGSLSGGDSRSFDYRLKSVTPASLSPMNADGVGSIRTHDTFQSGDKSIESR
jgi:hypothetical protein